MSKVKYQADIKRFSSTQKIGQDGENIVFAQVVLEAEGLSDTTIAWFARAQRLGAVTITLEVLSTYFLVAASWL